MALFRSFNEIVKSMQDRLKLTQPNLDTKPGTVARDLFIDPQAEQLERLHKSIVLVSEKQSMLSSVGDDLDKFGSNFNIKRKRGAQASGLVVFTTNELVSDIPIGSDTLVTAKNGVNYRTIGSFVMSVSDKNRYIAIASRLRKQLNIAGITDKYAIEIPVQATSIGRNGNIGPLQIISAGINNFLKVTNLSSFNNGENIESDSAYKSKIFGAFSGAATGTSFGYRNTALSISGVLDSIVVEPGNALMLRDGTETIQVNDGSFRILNSGTGGKVDLYILGRSLIENFESYIYIDKSGNGDATDERNNYIPGISFLDNTLTSEERRILAFKSGQIPLQPIDSIVSVTGSNSGVFTEKTIDSNGNVFGHFELVKDLNDSTGGSPFGYDYIRFISNRKDVSEEVIIKKDLSSIDPLKFTDSQSISSAYQDIQVTFENSSTTIANRSLVTLNHKPVTNVSRVLNRTTGEVYVVISQRLNELGLNVDGVVHISGKTLPSSADILSVDYTWRHFFDEFIDYNGDNSLQRFTDSSVNDSIDWGAPSGIFEEESIITQSDDGFEYQINTKYPITRVLSAYTYLPLVSTVSAVTNSGKTSLVVIIDNSAPSISNILSVKVGGLEVWDTLSADGSFNTRTIYLPTDSPAIVGDTVAIKYNATELFNIANFDGNFSNNTITLSSSEILDLNNLLDEVEDLFLTSSEVYVKYVSNTSTIIPSISMNSLPIIGDNDSDRLSTSSLIEVNSSNQPIFFNLVSGIRTSISKFGPTKLACGVSGITNPGKIKISGTSLNRYYFEVTAGVSFKNSTIDLQSNITAALGVPNIPSSVYVSRVDSVFVIGGEQFNLAGYSLFDNVYDLSYAKKDSSIKRSSFKLPDTNLISVSAGQKIGIYCLLAVENDFENLYFSRDQINITQKSFGRIDKITIASGFKNSSGGILGNIKITSSNQPNTGTSYFADYSFASPKEGERITLRYNSNNLISEVTRGIEAVRPITADILVKEAFVLEVDVFGEILINDDASSNKTQIIENATNAVVNLLNTGVLGGTIDYSDIISAVGSIVGVDSVNISLFNITNNIGRKTFIRALDNQTINAGNISFRVVSRKDFRIT